MTRPDLYVCECGGLRYKCRIYGHLPASIGHYLTPVDPTLEPDVIGVVWSGRGELLPDRDEHRDPRIYAMPTFDLDDGEAAIRQPSRKYTHTGRHIRKVQSNRSLHSH